MMLPDPPPGWAELQKKARRARDPKKLTAIIDEMNKLLSEYEHAAGDCPDEKPPKKSRRKGLRRSAKKKKH